jgi:Xaa-Pro aminopeptidase
MEAAEMLHPGINVKEIALACLDGMRKRGVEVKFECGRMGHGIGLNSTEPPSITLNDDVILKEGMVIALEPGISNDDGLYDIEEIFVVRKNGGECLTDSNRRLHIIPKI